MEKTISEEEAEKVLRYGAEESFSEYRIGELEKESNNFMTQDIDSILERRSLVIIHEHIGRKRNPYGGTFPKVSHKPSNEIIEFR